MPQTASAAFTELLNAFILVLTGGYARTVGDVTALLSALATIELIVDAIGWYTTGRAFFVAFFWKLFGFGFLFWLVRAWPDLLIGLRTGFLRAGLAIGGNVLTVNDLTDPGNLVDFGFSVTAVLLTNLTKMTWLRYGFVILFAGLAGWLVVLFYIGMAVHLFKALLEYYIVGACLLFLVPFLAHQKTAFIGERVFGTFVSHALRLMIYAVILNIALPVFFRWQLGPTPDFHDAMMLLTVTLLFFSIMLSAPALASGVIHGQGVWSLSNLLFGVQSAVATGAALGAVGAGASLAGAAGLRGAVSLGSAMREAAHIGAASSRASRPLTSSYTWRTRVADSVGGGARGMATYSMRRMGSSFTAASRQGRTRAQNTMP
jgi:P-type conjugative transfer protein TrbL